MPELFPYPSQERLVGTHRQRYVDVGSGERTLLCVHGNPTWSFYYRSIVERFSDRYRVIAVDHLGCGRSDKPPRDQFPYTLAAHRDNLVELLDQLDLQKVTLIAHDWGGAIGLATLLERRSQFERIVLLNTGAFPPPYLPWRIAACRIPGLGPLAVRGFNAFARAAITMAMSRNRLDPQAAAGLLQPYDNWANRVAIDAFVRDIPMRPSHPTYATLAQLESQLTELSAMPAALIWGMKDWCFRPECLRRFEQHWPEAKVIEIEDAGHYVIEDANAEVLDGIEAFFAESEQNSNPARSEGDG
ncbi:MAG: alpha/beta fold hydrolase [Rubripirellula sp.]|nr:alpha/beta fold hydrolase [Rubripirellula sp.]